MTSHVTAPYKLSFIIIIIIIIIYAPCLFMPLTCANELRKFLWHPVERTTNMSSLSCNAATQAMNVVSKSRRSLAVEIRLRQPISILLSTARASARQPWKRTFKHRGCQLVTDPLIHRVVPQGARPTDHVYRTINSGHSLTIRTILQSHSSAA